MRFADVTPSREIRIIGMPSCRVIPLQTRMSAQRKNKTYGKMQNMKLSVKERACVFFARTWVSYACTDVILSVESRSKRHCTASTAS